MPWDWDKLYRNALRWRQTVPKCLKIETKFTGMHWEWYKLLIYRNAWRLRQTIQHCMEIETCYPEMLGDWDNLYSNAWGDRDKLYGNACRLRLTLQQCLGNAWRLRQAIQQCLEIETNYTDIQCLETLNTEIPWDRDKWPQMWLIPFSCSWFDSLGPINNLSVMYGWVFLGWTSTKLGLMCLAQGHNAVKTDPVPPRSLVKHSTTEPLHSHQFQVTWLKHPILFDLILYVPVNCISVMSGWVFLG